MAAVGAADYDHLIKVILIGDSGVGKSAILRSYVGEGFSKAHVSTIGVDFEIKQVVMQGQKVHLQVWDTAGQERFRTITTSYYRSSDAILCVFDVTDTNSFKNVDAWLEDIRQYARKDVDILLVGNKADLEDERTVEFKTAKEYADENYIPYIETSAKLGRNIDKAFTSAAMTALLEKMAAKSRMDAAVSGGAAADAAPAPRSIRLRDGNEYRSADGASAQGSEAGGCCG